MIYSFNTLNTPLKNELRTKRKYLSDVLFLFPIWLLYFAEIFSNYNVYVSGLLKQLVFLLMLIFILYKNSYNRTLLFIFLFFVAFLFLNLLKSFNFTAGLEEFIRFLFLPVVLMFGYSYREKIDLLILSIIMIAFLSDIYQILVYLSYYSGSGFFESQLKDGTIYNSGFFSVSNALLNFIAFILVFKFYHLNYRRFFLVFFYILTFLTFSYKTLPFLFISLFIFIKKHYKFKLFIIIVFLTISFLSYNYILEMYEVFIKKIDFYIVVGNSARFESYRVMGEFLSQTHLLGEGLGSFGGPSSVIHHSPIYAKYNFDWFGMDMELKTTDTFYPHLFVELGTIGAFLFLSLLILPVFQSKNKDAKQLNLFILTTLIFDALMSFSLSNLFMLSYTVMLFYGINYKYEGKT